MLSANFKIEDDCLIGISEQEIKRFLRQFALTHKKGKMYVLKAIEVTASQLIVNYYGVCLSEASKALGYTREEVESLLKNYLVEIIKSKDHIDYDSSFLTKEIEIDGEIIPSQVKSFSRLTNTQYAAIIDLLSVVVKNINPDFIMPDPSGFIGKGQKNELDFPNLKYKL